MSSQSNQSGSKSGSTNTHSNSGTSSNRIIKDGGFGSYNNFNAAHGVKPGDHEGHTEIMNAYKEADAKYGKK
ncbi:hypothetical protein GQ43DRAFT_442241 [Delitschia confertaspora ATCC 74209]|uniref:Uncharacterized protein n=1 Tax=Delitschia confertaspora ATCC 74209 TaxID=1513339 RepID=A0A9P4JM58_9PLEO|nr:hypothetical protein GQ43DRAFT_442241 [Delitschia confertaspora ATCC 74209]